MTEQQWPTRDITFALEGPTGERADFKVDGPGGEVRFCIGVPGRRTSIWKVWAGKSKSDVYIAARVLGKHMKYSLHESGDWRTQWHTPESAYKYTGTASRVIDRWARPAEAGNGWTHAFSILVPRGATSTTPEDPPTGDPSVTYLPEPKEGEAVALRIVIAATDRGYTQLTRTRPIAAFYLASGEVVLVLAMQITLTSKDWEWLRSQHASAVATAGTTLIPDPSTRVGLFGQQADGSRWVWDLCGAAPIAWNPEGSA